MSFKDMIARDNVSVFMNQNEFAETKTVSYDGIVYSDISCVICKIKEKDRTVKMSDHGQGIYLVTQTFHCDAASLEGNIPEKGRKFRIREDGYWHDFYVGQSSCAMGMIRLELEAIDE